MKKHKSIFFTLLLLPVLSSAQTKKMGNVVEYFGKEKVETTTEGTVVHHFTDGLILGGATRGGALFNGQDLMSWLLATDNYKTPVLGQKVAFDYPALKDSERSAASQRLNLRGGHP
ncbi:MAG: hypothetical protein RR931_04815, partial [Mucinivorans sp.]